jgi:hypothetical protein
MNESEFRSDGNAGKREVPGGLRVGAAAASKSVTHPKAQDRMHLGMQPVAAIYRILQLRFAKSLRNLAILTAPHIS